MPGTAFRKADCNVLNSGQTVEECDATGLHSSNAAWLIKNIDTKCCLQQ